MKSFVKKVFQRVTNPNKLLKILTASVLYLLLIYFAVNKYNISVDFFLKFKPDNKFFVLSGAALILTIPNWLTEALKWKFAVAPIERIDFFTSLKGVLSGIAPSMFTPNRVGEAVGRPVVLKMSNRVSGGVATLWCGFSQMPVMLIAAFAGSLFLRSVYENDYFFTTLMFSVLSLLFAILLYAVYFFSYKISIFEKYFVKRKSFFEKLHFLDKYSLQQKWKIFLISALRYIVYVVQNVLLLYAFGIEAEFLTVFFSVVIMYALMSFVPRPAWAEIGVRCSAAVYVTSLFTNNCEAIIAASSLLWVVNLLIPAMLGVIFFTSGNNHNVREIKK